MKLDKKSEVRKILKKIKIVAAVVVVLFLIGFYFIRFNNANLISFMEWAHLSWVVDVANRMGWLSAIAAFLIVSIGTYLWILDVERKRERNELNRDKEAANKRF